MNRILLILLLFPLVVSGQSTYKILADSTRFGSINNTGNELIIQNDTRDSLGVLSNTGTGHTQFKNLRLQQLTDSTFRLLLGTTQQGQTILIPSSGGGSERNVDSAFLFKNAGNDSTCLIIYISGTQYRTCAIDNTGGGTNIYNSDGTITDNIRTVTSTSDTLEITNTGFRFYNDSGWAGITTPQKLTLPGPSVYYLPSAKWILDYTTQNGFIYTSGIEQLPAGLGGGNPYITNSAFNPSDFRTSSATYATDRQTLVNQSAGGGVWSKFEQSLNGNTVFSGVLDSVMFSLAPSTYMATLHKYGIGRFIQTPTYYLGVNTGGVIVETPIPRNVDTMYHITDSIAYTINGLYYSIPDETGGGAAYTISKNAGLDSTVLTDGINRSAAVDDGWHLISTSSPSGVSSVDLALTGWNDYQLEYLLEPVTDNVGLYARFSVDGGSTYISGSEYFISESWMSSGGVSVVGSSGSQTYMLIGMYIAISNRDSMPVVGNVIIPSPGTSTEWHSLRFSSSSADQGGAGNGYYTVGSGWLRRKTAVTHIRVLFSSGNIERGYIRLYGRK